MSGFHIESRTFLVSPEKKKTKSSRPKDRELLWWGRTDSNHRSDTQQIYSLSPLATRELPHMKFTATNKIHQRPVYYNQKSKNKQVLFSFFFKKFFSWCFWDFFGDGWTVFGGREIDSIDFQIRHIE